MALFSGLFLGFPVFLVGYFFFVYTGDAVLYYGAEGFQERQRILDLFGHYFVFAYSSSTQQL